MGELWLPVVEYEGLYEVSDLGRVRSLDRVTKQGAKKVGRVLKPHKSGHSTHQQVHLCRDGTSKSRKVHQLVLEAFVGPRPDGCMALHYNDVKTDNRLVNLRWGTCQENRQDAIRNGLLPDAYETRRKDSPAAMLRNRKIDWSRVDISKFIARR
ncbi:NUMOD4 motif-containing HNH endonuclease [Propionimicrobium sp. PCR01-08-3]|uniref:NUMOD4 motif-containing HNH endonuclease n=1 Tax=Propionimicrobium sp. PCR01-08-3 TaxID=3052086 RepID=UPI00333EA7E7